MRLAMLGGGGFRTPLVLSALRDARDRLAVDEVVLHDVDPARTAVIEAVWSGLVAESGSERQRPFAVRSTTDLRAAVRGADVVFCAVRVGGASGRVQDERGAMAAGLLGQETVGAGGLTYAMRTVPVTDEIARVVHAEAPEAWILNFTNPAGIITESMREFHERVVGICDTPIGLVRRALRALGLPASAFDAGQVGVDYAGLNHLGWLRGLRVGGVDRLPEITQDPAVAGTLEEGRLVGTDWIRATGALPNEYVYYYLHARRARTALAGARRTRGEQVREQQLSFAREAGAALARGDAAGVLRAWQQALRERDQTYMATERAEQDAGCRDEDGLVEAGGGYHEVAIDLMAALLGGEEHRMILGVPNRRPGSDGGGGVGDGGGDGGGGPIVPALDAAAMVEVPVLATAHAVTPLVPEVLPTAEEQALMASLKASERLTIAAARARGQERVELAWRAIAAHPLVDDLDGAKRLAEGA